MKTPEQKYKWFVLGDLNGFFGLMFDNLTVLSFLAGILIFVFKYPADIVYTRMFPGTAFGVLFGDLVYTWMAFRLAKRTGNGNVTAMPLGLDTPSTIGLALVVLGPAFVGLKAEGMAERDAAMMTWYIGMATMMFMGIIKLVFSFFGSWVQRIVPQAGLLGSLAGIGLGLIGMTPLIDIFGMPLVGLIALGLIFYTLVAGIRLPWKLPGVFVSVLLGTAVYYLVGPLGIVGGTYAGPPAMDLHLGFPIPTLGFLCLAGPLGIVGGTYAGPPAMDLHLGLPIPTLEFLKGLGPALKYLPLAIPFGILTVVGGINVTESARVAGDDYNTRNILLTEAVATIVAGLCGGVAQSTPYIGQPAYKNMGSRAGYTLLTGIFVGLGGILGYVSLFVELIPRAVLAPILVFVAFDIIMQSFQAVPKQHAPAVAFAFFPTIARLLAIKLGNPEAVPTENFQRLMTAPGKALPELQVIIALGNGFIVTGMLWAAYLAEVINRRLRVASVYLLILAAFTFFGVIHSAMADGSMYLPWTLGALEQRVPYQFTMAYVVLAAIFFGLSYTKESREPGGEGGHKGL